MTDEIFVEQPAGYYEEETWSKGLSREDTLEKQIRFISYFYSKGLWNEFQYSLKILIPLLPKLIRDRFTPLPHAKSEEDIEQHYQQFLGIQTTLESDTNMIWRKKFIKTYE